MTMNNSINNILNFDEVLRQTSNIENLITEYNIKEHRNVKIHDLWDEVSELYHTREEQEFLLELLSGAKESLILDPSYGSGFFINLLYNNNYRNIFSSDIRTNHLLKQRNEIANIPWFYSEFKDLQINSLKKEFDFIFVVGASLSYCQSWDLNFSFNESLFDLNEIFKSIDGLKSVLSSTGVLFIGNAKTYNSGNNPDRISFYDSHKNLKMKWALHYDWVKKLKKWECELFDSEFKSKEKFALHSHLFSNEMLVEYCSVYFNDVEIINAPSGCPEDIIKCSNPK